MEENSFEILSVSCTLFMVQYIIFQSLAINNNKNLTSSSKIAKVSTKACQILIKPYRKLPMNVKIWPKWQNFAKSGHTASSACIANVINVLKVIYFQ